MGRITKNYLYNLAYQMLVLLVPLITAPYLARTLGAVGTGVYGYVHSLTALICTVVMLGIFNYGSRQIAYVRDDSQALCDTFWRIMTVRLILAGIGTVVYFIIVAVIGRYQNLFLIYYTYLLGYFVDCTWLYVGVEDMKWAALKNAALKLITVAGIFLFVHDTGDTAVYVLIQGSSILMANLLAYTQLRRYVYSPKVIFKGTRNDIWQSAKLFLPSMASALYLECDKIMLELMTNDSSQVSYYSYSEKLVLIPLSFITVMSTVMMPRIANEYTKGHMEKISSLLNRGATFSLFMAIPMFAGILATIDKLIPWYLGDEFLPTITAVCVISPIILTNTLSGISGSQYFTATDQTGILLKAQISAAVGNIIINAILIPQFGFVGAAVATTISSTICAVVQYFHLLKQVKLPGLIKTACRYGVISLTMFAFIRITTHRLCCSPWTSALQMGIGIFFYLIVCGILKDEQLSLVILWLKKVIHRKE